MKWGFDFSEIKNRYLRVNIDGQLIIEEQKRMLDEITGLEAWHPEIPILFDNRKLDMSQANSQIIRRSVTVLIEFTKNLPKTKIAGLVATDLNFGFGRQFETLYEIENGASFRIFRDEKIAIEWLLEE